MKALEVIGLTTLYNGHPVIQNLSLSVEAGEILSIIGPSGTGKTTLLRCINLLKAPSEGKIILHGQELVLKKNKHNQLQAVNHNDLIKFRQKISFVFQGFYLWHHKTALENIIEAPIYVLQKTKKEAINIAEELLHKVGMIEHKNKYPASLSGGQQQRVAIARALAVGPEVLLLDEPTSALDLQNKNELCNLLMNLVNKFNLAIIFVSHDLALSEKISSKVAFIYNGQIIEEDIPHKIFLSPKSPELKRFLTNPE